MSSYIPGAGLKSPQNSIETPIYPNIKKGPPRFIWSRKNWKVETGPTQAAIQHIPQLQEAAILFQSRDYNSQHAYGKFSSRIQSVNKEFRPPMQDRDDFLPLSRIPRPVVIPRINPGGAFSNGNSVFAQQNMTIPGVEKYLTDRVKEGEIRPTFFAPTSAPVDNSILPDLELKLPAVSASSGFKFPNASQADLATNRDNFMSLDYNRDQVSATAGQNNRFNVNAQDARENMELGYNRPQTSAVAGFKVRNVEGFTHIDFDLEDNRPAVSVSAGTGSHAYSRIDNIEHELFDNRPSVSAVSGTGSHAYSRGDNANYEFDYNRPNVAATSGVAAHSYSRSDNIDYDLDYNKPQTYSNTGFKMNPIYGEQTSVEQLFKETDKFDLQKTGSRATPTVAPIYDMEDRQIQNGSLSVTDAKHNVSYNVPKNTLFQTQNSIDGTSDTPFYREKPKSMSNHHGNFSTQGYIRRAGLDIPQNKIKTKKGY